MSNLGFTIKISHLPSMQDMHGYWGRCTVGAAIEAVRPGERLLLRASCLVLTATLAPSPPSQLGQVPALRVLMVQAHRPVQGRLLT